MVDFNETARFPGKLNRDGIIARIAELHAWARGEKLDEMAKLLDLPADAASADIGARVLSALALVTGKPEYAVIVRQLQILALNLKNLK